MDDYEDLLKRLMAASPGMEREEVESRVQEKKRKIGAGYLTDQGALFLVASDLGVHLTEPLSSQSKLKDLHAGIRDVSLEVRVMSVSAPRQYTRKDGTPLHVRSMIVYDEGMSRDATLWDVRASDPVLKDIEPGDPVKITGAYVKANRDGDPEIHLGESAEITVVSDLPDIPGIDKIEKDVGDLAENDRNAVVVGVLAGPITTMNFTNPRGQPRRALQMRLQAKGGSVFRAVIWGQDDSVIPKMVPPKAKVRLIGVRAKPDNSGLEIHGSESTAVRVAGEDTLTQLTLRVLSVSAGDRGGMLLCADRDRTLYFVTDEASHYKVCSPGDVIECMPTKASGRSITVDEDGYMIKADDDASIPRLPQLRTRLAETDVGGDYCVEVVVLQDPEIRDIQTRSGESIQLLEMHVGDDTDQMWLKGWRNQARLAGGCKTGDRLSITAVSAKLGLEDRVDLMLTAYSAITPIAGQ